MAKKQDGIKNLKYEQALAELEGVIEQLEANTGGLEESVKVFERGKALIQHCQSLLDTAELKVHQLEEDGSQTPLE